MPFGHLEVGCVSTRKAELGLEFLSPRIAVFQLNLFLGAGPCRLRKGKMQCYGTAGIFFCDEKGFSSVSKSCQDPITSYLASPSRDVERNGIVRVSSWKEMEA